MTLVPPGYNQRHFQTRCQRHNQADVNLWGALRTFLGRAALAFVLVLVQIHFCEPTYVRASGETCLECLELPVHLDDVAGISDAHGECHDCCEIKACETPHGIESLATQLQVTFDYVILPEPLLVPELAQAQTLSQRYYFTRNAPPTGPPMVRVSRGPPTPRFVQPSAGCEVTFLA